jgi:hypothetical protein
MQNYDGMPQSVLEDAQLNLLTINALQLSLEFADVVREGYSQDSFYGDEGEWTRDNHIEAMAGNFWRLNRLCIPRNSKLPLSCTTIRHLVTKESPALLPKRSTNSSGNEFAKMPRCERCVMC